MKKIKLSILVLLLGICSSFSQNLDIRGYGGFNVMQLSSDQGTSLIDGVLHSRKVSGRPGYQFGAAITFGERFYVQPGFQYSVLSTEIINDNTVTDKELKDETTLNVIAIPLKVGVKLINPEVEDVFNIRLFAGFNGHHVLSVDHKTKSGEIDDIDKGDYNNLIIDADFGIGIDLFFLFLDYGYQLGLTPVHSGADKATANSFYFNLGVRIKLK